MPNILRLIAEGGRSRRVPADQPLLHDGETPVEVYMIQKGVVKMYERSGRGGEKILHLLRPPAIVPLAFFSGAAHPTRWNYATLTDCELCVLPFNTLLDRLKQHNEVAIYLMNWFSQEVHDLLVRLSGLESANIRGKMITVLRFLAQYHARPIPDSWRRVVFPVSHKLLASMLGVRRESVTMTLGDLQAEGLVRTSEFLTLDINSKILRTSGKQL